MILWPLVCSRLCGRENTVGQYIEGISCSEQIVQHARIQEGLGAPERLLSPILE